MASHSSMPTPPPTGHVCTEKEIMERIDRKMDTVIERLGKGDTALALHDHRLQELEKAGKGQGYGATAVNALIFWAVPLVGGGVLYSIFKSGGIPGAHP